MRDGAVAQMAGKQSGEKEVVEEGERGKGGEVESKGGKVWRKW